MRKYIVQSSVSQLVAHDPKVGSFPFLCKGIIMIYRENGEHLFCRTHKVGPETPPMRTTGIKNQFRWCDCFTDLFTNV